MVTHTPTLRFLSHSQRCISEVAACVTFSSSDLPVPERAAGAFELGFPHRLRSKRAIAHLLEGQKR